MTSFSEICLAWIDAHTVWCEDRNAWFIVDEEGVEIDGPFYDTFSDDYNEASMAHATDMAMSWWQDSREEVTDDD